MENFRPNPEAAVPPPEKSPEQIAHEAAWRKDNADFAFFERRAEEEIQDLGYEPRKSHDRVKELLKLSDEEKTLTREEKHALKKSRLEAFRDEIGNQSEIIGQTILELRTLVDENPEVTAPELHAIVMSHAAEARLDAKKIAEFDLAILRYRTRHKAVEKARADFPNDVDFFEACFARAPKGPVRVEKGPMTILFRCFSKDDYAYAASFANFKGKVPDDYIKEAEQSGGVAVKWVKVPELENTVIIEQMHDTEAPYVEGYEKYYNQQTRRHEEQHQFNKLFPVWWHRDDDELLAEAKGLMSRGGDPKEMLIRNFVRRERMKVIDMDARDEFLAFYRDGRPVREIVEKLQDLEIYQFADDPKYIAYAHDHVVKNLTKLAEEKNLDVKVTPEDIKPIAAEIFGPEYKKDIAKWGDAIGELNDKGYFRDDILAMLMQEPVNSWPQFAKRMPSRDLGL